MGRSKLVKREEFNQFPNCFNNTTEQKGKWSSFFGNDNPIVVELGCGKGDLACGLAKANSETNYIGVDIKAIRMWSGARQGLDAELKNLAFLRADIHGIANFFAEAEVAGLWITFPDPYPRKKATKNRMINERFLTQYTQLLKPGGQVWFKTDNEGLFDYAIAHFKELNDLQVFKIEVEDMTRDLHKSDLKNEENGITTDFERRFLDIGKTINYMRFKLAAGPQLGQVPARERVALDHTERAPKAR